MKLPVQVCFGFEKKLFHFLGVEKSKEEIKEEIILAMRNFEKLMS